MNGLYDVIVVGAGPSGSSTAHYLATNGLDVLLLDRATFPRDKTCGDGLTPRALHVLTNMGIVDEIKNKGYLIKEIEVYAPRGHKVTTKIPDRDGMPNYLINIPRRYLDDIVRRKALSSGVKYQGGVHVKEIIRKGDTLMVSGGGKHQEFSYLARTVVIATGATTRLLMRLGIIPRVPSMILAARAYYECPKGLKRIAQTHMNGIPMPGYGWVFPIAENLANVGLGFWPTMRNNGNNAKSARAALSDFVSKGVKLDNINIASPVGPIRGYPLRTDFGKRPAFSDKILLVGEAAGLVNPLTGEGIDLALESGKLAAEHIVDMFKKNELSYQSFGVYDQKLRKKYLSTFDFLRFIRVLYVNRLFANRLIQVVNNSQMLRNLFVDILFGYQNAAKGLSPRILLRVLIGK